ncbi:MAG: radical SAM protein [Planctomycetota bacterium]|jgi:23S rRNA (adenine2503-C2)-methyltransferase
MINLLGFSFDDLQAAAAERLPSGAGVASDVYRMAMREGRFAPEELDLHPRSAAAWRQQFALALPEVTNRVGADGGDTENDTEKLVLRRHDSHLTYECVRIPMGRGRESLCASSQIGCRRACRFCETGRMGLLDDLSAAEIVAQVVVARKLGWQPRSIVFQGMGEALDNLDNLIQALHILTDKRGLAFSHDRITVCTVGHVDGIRRLAELSWKRLNLSLSLNAANDDLRRELMPIHRVWDLRAVQQALIDYRQRQNLQIGIHYCLMPDINDRRRDAKDIAWFCEPLGRVMVHLIPYNEGSHPITRPPTDQQIVRFVGWLREEGLPVRRRIIKGREVMAACGQLGNVGLKQKMSGPS